MLGRISRPRMTHETRDMDARTQGERLTTRYDPDDECYERQLMIVLDEQEAAGYTHDLAWFDAERN